MRSLMSGFLLWLARIVMVLVTFTVAGVIVAHCQNKIVAPPYINHNVGENAHETTEDMEEDIRLKSIFVIATEPRTIFWKKETKEIVFTGSFTTDDKSQVRNVQKGCYIALYCTTHNYLYALYPCKE